MEFTVVQGDIAAQRADALVNAAGTSLRMGSGVAGALRRGANGPIGEAAVSNGPIDLGAVAVTDAYDLDADYVIHAAAMPHCGDGRATAESIRDATRNALAKADELGCESLVVPILGTGSGGFRLRARSGNRLRGGPRVRTRDAGRRSGDRVFGRRTSHRTETRRRRAVVLITYRSAAVSRHHRRIRGRSAPSSNGSRIRSDSLIV